MKISRNILSILILICITAVPAISHAQSAQESAAITKADSPAADKSQIDAQAKETLDRLNKEVSKIESLTASLEYKYIQDPDLFESSTINKGSLNYLKTEEKSLLRIDFKTRQEDDLDPEPYCEDYIFDGVWLTRINYQLKQISMDQFAQPDSPVEVFTLVTNNFPLIGFSEVEKLKDDCEIQSDQEEDKKLEHIFLKVKKKSRYYEKYSEIDFYLDRKNYLPTKIIAKTIENDVYEITITDLKINKKINPAIFKFETPAGFDKNITRLEDKAEKNGNIQKKED